MIFYSVLDVNNDDEGPGYRAFTDREQACRYARDLAKKHDHDYEVCRILIVPTKEAIMALWEGRNPCKQRDVIYTARGK